MHIQPTIFNRNLITAALSTRKGGVSQAPYTSLNLGKSTQDNPEHVQKNRELFFGALGISMEKLTLSKQVHGTEVLTVNEPIITEGYDAMITNKKDIFLAVSVADCVPILVFDKKNQAVAAIHAGWRGTAGKIVTKALEQMKAQYGTDGSNCYAFIGACIGYDKFEVGSEVAEQFEDAYKKTGNGDKFFVDLKTANAKQFENFGFNRNHIEVLPYCTFGHNDLFFSHRKENGITGRNMAVIGMKNA
ncbi:MAG TPA: peptidoglycan editing factor PgeF [Flavobacteriales bacterium]|nr:peptidoglycan editing factor PgeF [Flavobacteriales bacterium]